MHGPCRGNIDFILLLMFKNLQTAQANADLACEKLRKTFADEKAAILEGLAHIQAAEAAHSEPLKCSELNIMLLATSGPYKGSTWTLKPRSGKAAVKIGRSTGKTFAVSLPEDNEVSTTHGKVGLIVFC